MVSKEIPMQCVSFGFRNRTKHEDPNFKWLFEKSSVKQTKNSSTSKQTRFKRCVNDTVMPLHH